MPLSLLWQDISFQAGIGHQDIEQVDQAEQPQRQGGDGCGVIDPRHGSRLHRAAQVQEKGNCNERRRKGRHGVIDGKLAPQRPPHLPPVHAQLPQQGELSPVAVCLAELLDCQDGSGGHGEDQRQIVQGKHHHGGHGGRFCLLIRLGVEGVVEALGRVISVPDGTEPRKLFPTHRFLCHGGYGAVADWTVPGQLVGHHQHKAVSIGIPQILIQRACLYPRQLQCLAGDPDGLPVVRQGRSQIVLAVDQILPSFQSHCGPPLHGPEGGIVAECHQHVPAGKLVVAGVVRQIVGDLGVLPLIDRVPPHRFILRLLPELPQRSPLSNSFTFFRRYSSIFSNSFSCFNRAFSIRKASSRLRGV